MKNPLRLPESALSPIQSHVAEFGQLSAESGGFFVGATDSPVITSIMFANGLGIERKHGGFAVSAKAIDVLFGWVENQGARVWAQFHSHPTDAFLSAIDIKYGFSVEGFTSAVIPRFSSPPRDSNQWGWWRYEGKSWQRITGPAIVRNQIVSVYTFGEDGVL